MIVTKRFHFQCESTLVSADVIEKLDNANYPIFTWPSAVLLAAFLLHWDVERKHAIESEGQTLKPVRVLELAAGTGLPSILCGKLGVGHCFLTERADQPEMLQHIRETIALNELQDTCFLYPLSWGSDDVEAVDQAPIVDIILGSDVFYSVEDMDDILFLIFQLMVANPKLIFYSTYQERDSDHSIEHLLAKYELCAELIPKGEFLHVDHCSGQTQLLTFESIGSSVQRENIPLSTFDDIYLLKIMLSASKSNLL